MSIDAQTETIPRVPAAVSAVRGTHVATVVPEVADARGTAEISAPEPEAEIAAPEMEAQVAGTEPDAEITISAPSEDVGRQESVQHMYEAGLEKLDALHDRWTAAMAKLREAQADEPGEVAA